MKTLTQEDIEKIRKDPDCWDWYDLSAKHKLSENFIREFQDQVEWHWILYYQILSEEFFLEFKDKLFKKGYFERCCYRKNYNNTKHFLKHGMKLNNQLKGYLIK